MKTKLSVLDLMMIGEDRQLSDTIADSRKLAQLAERIGYTRYWIAEHPNIPGIGSSSTTLLMQYLAGATRKIRIGAAGMMLPNHAPLIVAEQFATLDVIFSGRIDLGVGRAADAAGPALHTIRGEASLRDFENDILEISEYLADHSRQAERSIPEPHPLRPYILGSTLESARLAASMGLPYVFASHFAPRFLIQSIQTYRELFQPSEKLEEPYIIAGVNIIAADTKDEADFLASSHQKWVANLYSGKTGLLPKPEKTYLANASIMERAILDDAMACSVIGNKADVKSWLEEFLTVTNVDEIMVDARIYDPAARCHSYSVVSEAIKEAQS